MTPAVAERLAEQPVRVLQLPANGTRGQVARGVMLLAGWCFAEPGVAQAQVFLFDGDDATSGDLVAPISIPLGSTAASGPTTTGIPIERGIVFELGAGTCFGVIYARMFDP